MLSAFNNQEKPIFYFFVYKGQSKWGEITPNNAILELNKKRSGNIAPPVEPPDSSIVF